MSASSSNPDLQGHESSGSGSDVYVVDIRSDVLTKPTEAVLDAMRNGTLGDDVFDEDPTVHELESTIAKMFGMEAAAFMPSGTMGNLVSVMAHCRLRGREALLGDQAHLVIYEQGGMAQLGGVMPRTMPNKPDGTFELDDLHLYVRADDYHFPVTGVICVENTHCNCGGKPIPLDFLAKLRARADELSLPVHMDGARMFNAAVALGVEPREILQHVNSVSVCLSKGVGAPIGSVIGGTKEFVKHSKRLRKALGGGWRQPGPLAAAALTALKDYREKLSHDHRRAKTLAEGIMKQSQSVVYVDVEGVQTNMVQVVVKKPGYTSNELIARFGVVTEEEERALGEKITVRCLPVRRDVIRLITCLNITDLDIEKAIKKITYVLQELSA